MAEGQEPGQYPAGTKAKLQQALDTAKAAQVKENVTEEELRQAIRELKAAAGRGTGCSECGDSINHSKA